jgi:NAD-dependent deacetylase
VLIVGGTSLAVYPAAGLLDYYRGKKLVLVNKTPTPRDSIADLIVQGSIGEIFSQLD